MSDRPWHAYITLDLLFQILRNSVFHPFITLLIPFCLRALGHPSTSSAYRYSIIYFLLVSALWLLAFLDDRLAYGAARVLDWQHEVVVITGGASGLGKILAQTYGMRGASVAVLDVQSPAEQEREADPALADVRFYRCDVGDAAAVERVKSLIDEDLGPPTILINNAGIVAGKPLLELSAADVQRTLSVNLLAHFHALRVFLPALLAAPSGGTIVTVSSVLGKLGASHLSDYTAAKAGLIALHRSLVAELASPLAPAGAANVRTVLVTPGQLSTALFAGVQTPSAFFGPVVEPVELARDVVRMVDGGRSGEISLPLYARWIDWMFVLPVGVQKVARWMAGVDRAMEGFRGTRKTI
nr:epidermal retinol dehydrogenase 2 [Quercus suber]